jgi:hypothetical protein
MATPPMRSISAITPVSSKISRRTASAGCSPGSIMPPGSPQVPSSLRRPSRIRPSGSRTTPDAAGTNSRS